MRLERVESPAKAALKEITPEIETRVKGNLSAVSEIFRAKVENHNRNYDFYMGNQWNNEELGSFKDQARYPYVMNEILHKVDHLCGMQAQTRMDVKAVPRESSDEIIAEIASFLLKWADQTNRIEHIESEVFKDGIIGGAGASVVRWTFKDLIYGYPSVESVPMNELFWDANSMKQDLNDARWMARIQSVTRLDAIEMFPEYAEEIKDAYSASSTYGMSTKVYKVQSKRQKDVSGFTSISENDIWNEKIDLIEYYEKINIYKYVVVDEIRDDMFEFDFKAEAEAFCQGLKSEYYLNHSLLNGDGSDRVYTLMHDIDGIYQTIMIGDTVVYHARSDLPEFPFQIFFAYFNKGDYWGVVDNLIPPQILVNRSFTQLDYQLGSTSKNAVTFIPSLLHRGFTPQQFQQEWSKTSPKIPVMRHDAIASIPNSPINAELYQSVMFGIGRMNDYAGGKSALGLQENASESGRAIMARAEQGGLARLPFFDSLRSWREQVSHLVLWYIKNFMPANQIVRVIGSDDSIQYKNIDIGILDSIAEQQLDLEIDEAIKSDNMKERQLQSVVELLKSTPGIPPEVATNMMLEYMSIPNAKKDEIREQLQFYQQFQQQKQEAQKQEKIQQEVQDSAVKKKLKDQLARSEELEKTEEELLDKEEKIKQLTDNAAPENIGVDPQEELPQMNVGL